MSTRNVLDWLEDAAENAGSSPAFDMPGQALTWRQARARAKSAGSFLAARVSRQRPVLILMEKSPDCLCAMLGAVYAGCFYTPLDSSMPENRMRLIAGTLRPGLILCEEKFADTAGRIAGDALVCGWEEIGDAADEALLSQRRKQHIDNDLLYVLFTSGSTGAPKGVSITHRSVVDFVEWACEALRLPKGPRFGSQAPFYFDNSVLDIYCAMKTHGSLHLIPKGDFMFPKRLVQRLSDEKIDTVFWVPSALTAVARAQVLAENCLPGLKRVFFCGEVMPCFTLNRWREALPDADYVNMYGPTEITDVCAWYRVDRAFADTDSLPIGFPCENTRIHLIDGEICVCGACLSPGYYNAPDKTAAAFVQNPLRPEITEIIYKTGDLGEYNGRGELMFLGRRDSQIKRSGYRIELGEVEAALNAAENVALACCYYDAEKEKIIAAYTGSAEEKALKKHLKAALPKYMLPDVILRREALPRTGSGKIDRKALRQEAEHEHLIP
ncbi:MAG: amino acid adenylation domain-containing protein [Clostridia bacterium]|nr:amino acid adenylation domain-containing protein [Clostridia bacterium]